MKLYLSIIGAAMLVISVFNIIFETAAWYYIVVSVIWCPALQFALDGSMAFLTHIMPDSWFGVDNPLYRISDTEKRLYKKLGVRRWKDKVWELGGLGGFSKSQLRDPRSPEYIEKFIIECNKGVMTHRLSYPLGFLAMLTLKSPCAITIALPVAIVNLLLNILPTLVLRHNTPMLKSLLKRMNRNDKAQT